MQTQAGPYGSAHRELFANAGVDWGKIERIFRGQRLSDRDSHRFGRDSCRHLKQLPNICPICAAMPARSPAASRRATPMWPRLWRPWSRTPRCWIPAPPPALRSTGCSPRSGIRCRSTASPQRRPATEAAGRAPSCADRAHAAPGLPAGRARRPLRRRRRQGARRRRAQAARAGRGLRPRARRRDRHRRADHRGRDLHRARPREPGGEPRPSRARRRAHAQGGGGAGQGQAAGHHPRRHPARRRLVRASTRSTSCSLRSRCRWSSSPPIRSAS